MFSVWNQAGRGSAKLPLGEAPGGSVPLDLLANLRLRIHRLAPRALGQRLPWRFPGGRLGCGAVLRLTSDSMLTPSAKRG